MPNEISDNLDQTERRRRIFERARARFEALKTPIDTDSRFLELIEHWIDGKLEMSEVARVYAAARISARPIKLAAPAPDASHGRQPSQDDLLAELDRVIGVFEPE